MFMRKFYCFMAASLLRGVEQWGNNPVTLCGRCEIYWHIISQDLSLIKTRRRIHLRSRQHEIMRL